MLEDSLEYHCVKCGALVRTPGHMGLSWCNLCQIYEAPIAVESDPPGDISAAGMDHAYTYTTWRPRGKSYLRGETPEHRFMFVKRTDRLTPKSKPSYKATCTCGKWNNPNGFTVKRAASRQWQAHMAEVEKQGTLPV